MDKTKRKAHILKVAKTCFEEHGFNQTSMDYLAQQCDLTKRTVYKYYRSKDELYFDLVCESFKKFESKYLTIDASMSALDQINTLMDCYIEFFEESPFLANLMVTRKVYEQEDPLVLEKIARIEAYAKGIPLPELIDKGIQEGHLRDDIDPYQQALIIWGALHGVIEIAVNKTRLIENRDVKSFLLRSKAMLIQSMQR
ncbi:TetR/AcrR family transcriptional regulator [Fusibacter ferrireducens]|uniref:TetR/AcrR family transcriptional regulator n=1 Tax=Fusibacter ferrireducens TaxID=2785058 RepID=A0ABR9ZZK6_9FIRM|nr:TetR/AcrR family transcriptional regulator [Fusibacter ferrireducens]MBF4695885.1 TetR/AcrR family transcriptional regulator [Fusibacter ferrireducens]